MHVELGAESRVVVESAWIAEALARRFPQWALHSPPLLWEDLLEWTQAPLSPDQRLTGLREFLTPREQSQGPQVLAALEQLREAGMWSEQEVEFVFGVLADTPKNRRLKELALCYLSSSLGLDRTEATLRMVENLREGKIALKRGQAWWFVRGDNPCPLFGELARAFPFAQGCQESGIRELADLFPSRGRGPRVFEGSPAQCFFEIARVASRLVRRGYAPEEIFIGFEGQPGEHTALRMELAARGLPLPEVPRAAPLSPTAQAIEAVRCRRDVNLKERLEQIHALRRGGISTVKEPWRERETETESPGLFVFPPHPVRGPLLIYGGRPLRAPANPWLREDEQFTLRSNGFSLGTDPKTAREYDCGGSWVFEPGAPQTRRPLQWARRENQAVPEAAPARYSPTQLESYTRCPARYFFGNRLRLQTRGRQSRFPLILGQVTHRVLEWAKKDGMDLKTGAPALLAKALEEAAPEWRGSRWETMVLTQAERLLAPVQAIEDDLAERFPGFRPFAFEMDFEIDLFGSRFRGQIDRVDRDEKERWLIFDYKTGNVNFTPNHIRDGSHFQALLYWIALEQKWGENGAAMVFYDLKKGEARRGVAIAEEVADAKGMVRGHTLPRAKWTALREQGEDRIREVVGQIKKGHFPPIPSPATCPTCDFQVHCGEAYGDE